MMVLLSYDPDGYITKYSWDFGDGAIGGGETTTHSYTCSGTYNVTLNISDDEGATDEDTINVVIVKANSPPTKPIVDGPTSGKAGEVYDYTFVATDPDGDDISYMIKWDDECTEVSVHLPSGQGITRNHTWSKKGTYTIRVIARDIYGVESAEGTLSVSMSKSKPYFNPIILGFLENHPHMFLLLCHLPEHIE